METHKVEPVRANKDVFGSCMTICQPSRIHGFFSGIFHSHPRAASPRPKDRKKNNGDTIEETHPSPVENNKKNEPEPTGIQDGTPAQDSKYEKLPNYEAKVVYSPDTKVSRTAYDEAWSQLSDNDRVNLSNETSVRTLFEKLDDTDQQHQSNSWLKRGKMAAGLQYVSSICRWVDLVAAWIPEPSLGAVLGLIKGVIALAVSICGAYDSLTGHIREFLDHIPVIERCNTVLWSNSGSFDIHNILVACYSTLLSFYSKVMAFLQEESRIKRMLETFRSEIPSIVADFNGHSDKLSRMMEVETLVTVRRILDQQTESFVDDNLYNRHHIGNRNADEDDRSDEACRWVISDEKFEDWAYGPHGVLTMYGVAGCGKTSTAAFVTKYLREEARAPVLAYYCTQQEDDELRLILCSLTYQLLQAKPVLKDKFKDWSEKRQAVTLDKPSNKPAVLAEFLYSSLQQSREQVFVILDGLDECEEEVRSALLVMFRNLISNGAPLKVFVSSRQRDDILKTLNCSERTEEEPGIRDATRIPLFHIIMNPTEERDRVLAKHLASKPLRQIQDSKVRENAIEQLAKRAGGSAIWLQMAMASLAGAKNEHRIMKCLQFLETDPKLVDWYERLFRDAESATCNDREILERALETLAVARRPLTIDELARAANIDDAENGKSLALLNEAAEEIDFFSLIRPFVATLDESGDRKDLRVRLVHQSLLELLFTSRPSEWEEMAKTRKSKIVTGMEKEQRRRELNEQLMSRCVQYLLLEDLEGTLFDEDADIPAILDADLAQEDELWDGYGYGFGDMFAEPATQKRTRTRAQVSHLHFYEYAATHWVSHYAACERDATEELKEDAIKLLNCMTNECTDWVSFVRTEKEAQGERFPSSSEPATLAAYFGLGETLASIVASNSMVSQPTKDEALFWASRGGCESIVKLLLGEGADPNQHIADEHTALTVAAHRGHLGCVQALLADQKTDINVEGTRSRTALSFAAANGHEEICAALMQREDCRLDDTDWKGMTPLFYAAGSEHVPIVKALVALPGVNVNHQENSGRTTLSRAAEGGSVAPLKQLLDTDGIDVNLSDNEGMTPLMWAAFMGNAAGAELLLQHPEIDKGAVNFKDRKNAIHFACQTGMHEVLLCLLEHGCPGVDNPDVDGWTPVMWAIQKGPECVSALIATCQVGINRRDNEGRTALSHAAQWGSSVEVIRILLHHGADPEARDKNGQSPLDVAMKIRTSVGFAMADELSSWINNKRGEHGQSVQSA